MLDVVVVAPVNSSNEIHPLEAQFEFLFFLAKMLRCVPRAND